METTAKLYSQIAQQAGVSADEAQRAAYVADLSRAGRSLDEAATLLRMKRAEARDIARDWGVSFVDYTPSEPIVLAWEKPSRGEWTLTYGGAVVARVLADGNGRYVARWERGDATFSDDGSSAEVAARRLSRQLEREAHTLFGADDVELRFPQPHSMVVTLAPKRAADPQRLQQALAA